MSAFLPAEPHPPIEAAAAWIEALVTGPLATTLAILAIAGVGFQLLAGRFDVMRSARVVLGVFVLLGSLTIARALLTIPEASITPVGASPALQPPRTDPIPAPVQRVVPADPYAGASVPTR